jgi:hypothetical protein
MQETRDYVVKVTGYRKDFVTAPVAPSAPVSAPAAVRPANKPTA